MKLIKSLCILLTVITSSGYSQSINFPRPYQINTDTATYITLPVLNWQYLKEGNQPLSLNDVLKLGSAFKFSSTTVTKYNQIDHSAFWLRYKIKNNLNHQIRIAILGNVPLMDTYIADTTGSWVKYVTGKNVLWDKKPGLKRLNILLYTIPENAAITVYKRVINDNYGAPITTNIGLADNVIKKEYIENDKLSINNLTSAIIFGFLLFAALVNFFFFYTVKEKAYLLYGILLLLIAIVNIDEQLIQVFFHDYSYLLDVQNSIQGLVVFLSLIVALLFLQIPRNHPRWNKVLLGAFAISFLLFIINKVNPHNPLLAFKIAGYFGLACMTSIFAGIVITLIIDFIAKRPEAKLVMLAISPVLIYLLFLLIYVNGLGKPSIPLFDIIGNLTLLWPVILLCWSLFGRFKTVLNENATQAYENERLAREKEEERNQMIAQQKEELEVQVLQRTAELSQSITNLKSAQAQLVQAEKMASLGELTAGIAHEIQNPLNFVNNFSEVNREMLEELKAEGTKPKAEWDEQLIIELIDDLIENEQKVNHHGKRADGIVRGMLEHSRASTGRKEPTDLNKLADEYLRLAYHGLRAKDKSFNADLISNFDPNLPPANIIAQDIGRVLLNLFNNAFYAVNEKQKTAGPDYKPTVEVKSLITDNNMVVVVIDNGNGIPENIKHKIMQPFFTTKPTGEGTGLGLSLSYDIIVKGHEGSINVSSIEDEGSEFTVSIPRTIKIS